MANPKWGTKRTCKKCATRFYDLNRAPAVCPICGTHHVDKPLAKVSAGAKVPPSAPRNTKPEMNDEAAQATHAAVTNDDDGDEKKEEEDTNTASEDGELMEDVSESVEEADHVAEVLDIKEGADSVKQ